jgi:two-component system C4-dicarboxylate transport sensor histidine kinase DctB
MYLMDTSGNTLAASNWDKHDSFVGRNFAFRPYFSEAMAGHLGRFFGQGTTSAKRGYFFAAAVHDRERIIGVLVVKVDLDHTETLGPYPEQLLLTDQNGVVILTSRPTGAFAPPAADRSRAPGDHRHPALPDPGPATAEPQPRRLAHPDPRHQGNRLAGQHPRPAHAGRPLGADGHGHRRRHAAGDHAAGRPGDAAPPPLHRPHRLRGPWPPGAGKRVAERTADLEGLNTRLKSAVLERENAQQELVRAQDELVQAGKLSVLGTMSASISHELNQPLAASAATRKTPRSCSTTSAPKTPAATSS